MDSRGMGFPWLSGKRRYKGGRFQPRDEKDDKTFVCFAN